MDISDLRSPDPALAGEAKRLLALTADNAGRDAIRTAVRSLLEDVLTCHPDRSGRQAHEEFCGTRKLLDDIDVIEMLVGEGYDGSMEIRCTVDALRTLVWKQCGVGNTRALLSLASMKKGVSKTFAETLVTHFQELHLFLERGPDDVLPEYSERMQMARTMVNVLSNISAQAERIVRMSTKGVRFRDENNKKVSGPFYEPHELTCLLSHIIAALEEGLAILEHWEEKKDNHRKGKSNLESWKTTLHMLLKDVA